MAVSCAVWVCPMASCGPPGVKAVTLPSTTMLGLEMTGARFEGKAPVYATIIASI